MHLPRVNVTEGLATMAVVAMLLAWSANADAMPPMRRLLDEAELLEELDQLALTRASTKGC